ncbi:MAG: imidazole glycerol phosphate synthase subunit HisF [Alphaproteobacteria bacterium]|nr:imidazole glycerol phosphate synthase subunit HisF [Alphaproteobacteria bacterium]
MSTKRRIIASLVLRDGIVVQSIGFERFLPVGRADIAARFLDDWGVDEIVLLDIRASAEARRIDLATVEAVAASCRVPLTVGGGIRSVEDVRDLIRAGADKVSLNRAALETPELIGAAAEQFGVQCIVASIDVRRLANGKAHVFADGARRDTGLDAADFARSCATAGAGEILLNAADRDGLRNGYDLDLVEAVANAVNIPVIALGGAGQPSHFVDLLSSTGASAAAAANMLHYSEHSVAAIKSVLRNAGLDIRLDSRSDYRHVPFLADGRLDRRPEAELADEIFEYIPKEII